MIELEEKKKKLANPTLRYNEYYGMQEIFDELYQRSVNGENFGSLIPLIFSVNNLRLAYRNLKSKKGSKTPGADEWNIETIKTMPIHFVLDLITDTVLGPGGYRPDPAKMVVISKRDGNSRSLGIPSILDRIIQQCIYQILEPICEAKFSERSHGFRPLYSTDTAINQTYLALNTSHHTFGIQVDIKDFYESVNHRELRKALWRFGIRDKKLIWLIDQINKAPILTKEQELIFPKRGILQGSILSPLLANVYLDECDKWIESQWVDHPIALQSTRKNKNGHIIKSNAYTKMKKTNLKEIRHVRYADDIQIYCKSYDEAARFLQALKKWLMDNLKLQLNMVKTRIVDLKKSYIYFLGLKIRLVPKGKDKKGKLKFVVYSRMSDHALHREIQNLKKQVRRIKHPDRGKDALTELRIFNAMVVGIQNYYQKATAVSRDLRIIGRRVDNWLHISLRITRNGRELTSFEKERFGDSEQLRYLMRWPIYPVAYQSYKQPQGKPIKWNLFSPEGRKPIYQKLSSDLSLLWNLSNQPEQGQNIEYHDNRISLYTAQRGRCAVTGLPFLSSKDIHCHHILPRHKGGDDSYKNLVCVLEEVHQLIHINNEEKISYYLELLRIDRKQLIKINKYRNKASMEEIPFRLLS